MTAMVLFSLLLHCICRFIYLWSSNVFRRYFCYKNDFNPTIIQNMANWVFQIDVAFGLKSEKRFCEFEHGEIFYWIESLGSEKGFLWGHYIFADLSHCHLRPLVGNFFERKNHKRGRGQSKIEFLIVGSLNIFFV